MQERAKRYISDGRRLFRELERYSRKRNKYYELITRTTAVYRAIRVEGGVNGKEDALADYVEMSRFCDEKSEEFVRHCVLLKVLDNDIGADVIYFKDMQGMKMADVVAEVGCSRTRCYANREKALNELEELLTMVNYN